MREKGEREREKLRAIHIEWSHSLHSYMYMYIIPGNVPEHFENK